MAYHWMGVGEAIGAAAIMRTDESPSTTVELQQLAALERRRLGLETDVVDGTVLAAAVRHFAKRGIVLPTFSELEKPASISPSLRTAVAAISADVPHPLNLFRIHWFNDVDRTGTVRVPGYLVMPHALTGVKATIAVMLGERFPMIAAHKVLAAYACLVPRLVTGQFDVTEQRAVWPSTGNYCRGGVAIARVMGCHAVAVLPAQMSAERFAWLRDWVPAAEDIVRTPGSESNVREIYDECEALALDPRNLILNQFSDYGNALSHHRVTGTALMRVFDDLKRTSPVRALHSFVSATGSAGTLSAGDRVREELGSRNVVVEATECPTLLKNGFGEHNIQGIGDRHVPLIHNVFSTDDLVGVSDLATDSLFYLCGDEIGRDYLTHRQGIAADTLPALSRLGLSAWANILAAIQIARAYDLDDTQAILTVATDSGELYKSERKRILERRFHGRFDELTAAEIFGQFVKGAPAGAHVELRRSERERIFNLGYFTWVEQRHVSLEVFMLRSRMEFWKRLRTLPDRWDEHIRDFNDRVRVGPGAR